jgi:hypothetical protein
MKEIFINIYTITLVLSIIIGFYANWCDRKKRSVYGLVQAEKIMMLLLLSMIPFLNLIVIYFAIESIAEYHTSKRKK